MCCISSYIHLVEIQLLLFSSLYYAGSLILIVQREKFHVADPKVQIPIGSVCTEKVSYCGFITCTCPWPYSYRYWCQYMGHLCPCWHTLERKREIIGRRRGWGGRGGDGDEAVKAEVALCSRTKGREKQRLSRVASPKSFFLFFWPSKQLLLMANNLWQLSTFCQHLFLVVQIHKKTDFEPGQQFLCWTQVKLLDTGWY